MKIFSLFFLLCACSQINTDSRDYHRNQKLSFDHGLISAEKEDRGRSDLNEIDKTVDEKSAARGKKLYQNNCLACHGAQGRGDGPLASQNDMYPRDLQEIARSMPNFKFYMNLSKFKGQMPGWKNREISQQDLNDLTEYLKSLALR